MSNGTNDNYLARTYSIILEALNSLASSTSTTATKLNDISGSCKDIIGGVSGFDKSLHEALFEIKEYKSETQSALKELHLRCSGQNKSNEGKYIEIISYQKLVADARKRNQILFRKLNLPTI